MIYLLFATIEMSELMYLSQPPQQTGVVFQDVFSKLSQPGLDQAQIDLFKRTYASFCPAERQKCVDLYAEKLRHPDILPADLMEISYTIFSTAQSDTGTSDATVGPIVVRLVEKLKEFAARPQDYFMIFPSFTLLTSEQKEMVVQTGIDGVDNPNLSLTRDVAHIFEAFFYNANPEERKKFFEAAIKRLSTTSTHPIEALFFVTNILSRFKDISDAEKSALLQIAKNCIHYPEGSIHQIAPALANFCSTHTEEAQELLVAFIEKAHSETLSDLVCTLNINNPNMETIKCAILPIFKEKISQRDISIYELVANFERPESTDMVTYPIFDVLEERLSRPDTNLWHIAQLTNPDHPIQIIEMARRALESNIDLPERPIDELLGILDPHIKKPEVKKRAEHALLMKIAQINDAEDLGRIISNGNITDQVRDAARKKYDALGDMPSD